MEHERNPITAQVLNSWGVGDIDIRWRDRTGVLISVDELKKAGFGRKFLPGTKQVSIGCAA